MSTPSSPASGAAGSAADRIRTLHVLVRGRVQGVGFRFYCEEEATRLGLTGSVRNLADGDVEVLVQGRAEDVAELLAWLRHGPRWARVDGITVTSLKAGSLTGAGFTMAN